MDLPQPACDAHVHVFGPQARFPYAAGRSFTPPEALKEALFGLHARLGLARCVVVQSTCHGYDNRVTADALAARPGAYRGVALLPPAAAREELACLDRAGFRGVRFNYMRHLGDAAPVEDVVAMTAKLAELGWHLQLHLDPGLIGGMAAALRRSATPVVIDHMGRVDAALGLDQPPFRQLLGLMEDERFWVKLSGLERCSRRGPPYEDALPFARKLAAEFGGRVLWGTDWPHPNLDHAPDEELLLGLVAEVAPSAALRRALLVDNPQRLYRFSA